MILVDTSVWVEHLRNGDARLADLLQRGLVFMHPFVMVEMACGPLSDRASTLELMRDMPMAAVADIDEVSEYIERHSLHGRGVGFVDVHLLVSTALSDGATLWTRDKRLHAAASDLGCADADPRSH